ncbi:GSCOCG00012276001-RA-CDS [Cotesia congregata]|nr:GSCOCG00012276001-RA-CDS [Cotesia congregata]
MILREERIDLHSVETGKYIQPYQNPESKKNNEEYVLFWQDIKKKIKEDNEELNLIDEIKKINHIKELKENERKIVEKLINNVKESYEEKYEFENYTMYTAINDPENPPAIMHQIRDIRHKLIASTDPAVLFTVYNAPKAYVNLGENIKTSSEEEAQKYYKYYLIYVKISSCVLLENNIGPTVSVLSVHF